MNMTPQFWRFVPALCLASAPLAAMLGDAVGDRMGRLPGYDWEALRVVIVGALACAGFAFYQAPRIDKWCAIAVALTGLSAAWVSFLMPGRYGVDIALLQLGVAALWLLAALNIFGTAYHSFRWLRWITLPLLFLAAAGCAAWFGYEVIYLQGEALVRDLITPPPPPPAM